MLHVASRDLRKIDTVFIFRDGVVLVQKSPDVPLATEGIFSFAKSERYRAPDYLGGGAEGRAPRPKFRLKRTRGWGETDQYKESQSTNQKKTKEENQSIMQWEGQGPHHRLGFRGKRSLRQHSRYFYCYSANPEDKNIFSPRYHISTHLKSPGISEPPIVFLPFWRQGR